MSKRKANGDDAVPPKSRMEVDDDDSGSDEDMDMINVDFEWFDPDPSVDFQGFKTLLRQLLDADHTRLNLSELADLLLTPPAPRGSTIKCDGEESDPFAFLTILDLATHAAKPVVQQTIAYFLARTAAATPDRHSQAMQDLLSPALSDATPSRVGLVLGERFINMPHQVIPPLWRMLYDEEKGAGAAGRAPYTHYLVLSRTYTEVESELDVEPKERASKKTKGAAAAKPEIFYFHPEDEVLQKHAVAWSHYDFELAAADGASDSRRAFQELGVRAQGHLILLETAKLEQAVVAVEKYLSDGA